MDYTEDFRLIQTSLIYSNEYVKKFEKILSYGGNEVYINEITRKLREIILTKGYDYENGHELRRINLFLMLNTEASFKYNLEEDTDVAHLINNFPQLSKCLLTNLIWGLKLEKYLYEAIQYAPSWFVLPFLDEIVDSLRFSKSFDMIDQVKELVESVYVNICRMDYKSIASQEHQIDQKIILGKLQDTVFDLLRNYNTPVTDTEVSSSKWKMKRFSGFALKNQLSSILRCFQLFQTKPKFEIEENLYIYKLMLEKEPEVDNFSSTTYSSTVMQTLSNINIAMLNTLQNSVMNVNLDDYMYWVEIDIDDEEISDEDLKRDNLQKFIGHQCYFLSDILTNNPYFEHNVVDQLATFLIKPKTLEDIAKEASIGTVLDRIEKSESKCVWLQELLNRDETLYCNTECLQTVIDNIEVVELKHLMKILNDYQEYAERMDAENEEQLKEIFSKGGAQLQNCEKYEFIEKIIEVFGDSYAFADIEQDMINYLNKITEENVQENEMWNFILKNPERFYENLLRDSENFDESQIAAVVKILNETNDIANNYLKRIIIAGITNKITQKSLKHMLLSGIFKSQLIERKAFIKEILMNNIVQALTDQNYEILFMLLECIKQICSKFIMSDFLPPLIILLAQILDACRWDIMTFTFLRENIVDITISIIQQFMKTILLHGSKTDKDWISAKIEKFKPLTKFYFQKLSLTKDDSITSLENYLSPNGFENASKTAITSFLCETLVRSTSKECRRLMDNVILRRFYTDAVLVISVIAGKSNNESALNCLYKCVTDYVKILVELIIPDESTNKNQLLSDIINLIKKLPSRSYDDLSILFLESLQMHENCENFQNAISELNDCELKKILQE